MHKGKQQMVKASDTSLHVRVRDDRVWSLRSIRRVHVRAKAHVKRMYPQTAWYKPGSQQSSSAKPAMVALSAPEATLEGM